MTTKPSIILVPGSFALPLVYDELLDVLRSEKNLDIRAIHPPSWGVTTGQSRPGPLPTMYDDASFIASEVSKLAGEGKDVVLLAHSYGGIPASQCVKGLAKEEREKQGKKGGIVQLGYMTCLVPPVGGSAMSLLDDVPEDQKTAIKIGEDGWMAQDPPEDTAKVVCSMLPLEEGTKWIRTFAKHSSASFTSELTYPGYKDVPVSYLFCEKDICIPVEVQKAAIDMIEKESGRKVKVTSIKADHCPNISALKETVDWIVDVAGGA